MLEPQGPLPEAVYWRRRAAAFGAMAVGVLLCLWGVTALAGSDTATRTGAPAPAAPPSRTSAAPPPSAAPSSTAPSPAPSSPGSVAPSAPNAEPAPPAVVATPGRLPPPPPPPLPPPGPCPDQVIAVTAQPSAPSYRPGERREFRMVITNTGQEPCYRDLDQALQEVLVLGLDGRRLWSSNDCYRAGGPAVRRLAPGEHVDSSVVWAGRTSQPGCPAQRASVGPGDYQLVARLGPLSSPPAPFHLD